MNQAEEAIIEASEDICTKVYDMVQCSCLCFPRHNFATKTESNLLSFQKHYQILTEKFSLKNQKHFKKANFSSQIIGTTQTISDNSSEMKTNWVQSLVQSCVKENINMNIPPHHTHKHHSNLVSLR